MTLHRHSSPSRPRPRPVASGRPSFTRDSKCSQRFLLWQVRYRTTRWTRWKDGRRESQSGGAGQEGENVAAARRRVVRLPLYLSFKSRTLIRIHNLTAPRWSRRRSPSLSSIWKKLSLEDSDTTNVSRPSLRCMRSIDTAFALFRMAVATRRATMQATSFAFEAPIDPIKSGPKTAETLRSFISCDRRRRRRRRRQ